MNPSSVSKGLRSWPIGVGRELFQFDLIPVQKEIKGTWPIGIDRKLISVSFLSRKKVKANF